MKCRFGKVFPMFEPAEVVPDIPHAARHPGTTSAGLDLRLIELLLKDRACVHPFAGNGG